MYGIALHAQQHLFSSVQEVPYALGEREFLGKEITSCGLKPRYDGGHNSREPCLLFRSVLFKKKALRDLRPGNVTVFDRFGTKMQVTTEARNLNDKGCIMQANSGLQDGVVLTEDAKSVFLNCPDRLKLTKRLVGQSTKLDSTSSIKTSYATYELVLKHNIKNKISKGVHNKQRSVSPEELLAQNKWKDDHYLLVMLVGDVTRVSLESGFDNSKPEFEDVGSFKREAFTTLGEYNTAGDPTKSKDKMLDFLKKYPHLAAYKAELEEYIAEVGRYFDYYSDCGTNQAPYSDLVICCMLVDKKQKMTKFRINAELETIMKERA